jgi:hypothetical protein
MFDILGQGGAKLLSLRSRMALGALLTVTVRRLSRVDLGEASSGFQIKVQNVAGG